MNKNWTLAISKLISDYGWFDSKSHSHAWCFIWSLAGSSKGIGELFMFMAIIHYSHSYKSTVAVWKRRKCCYCDVTSTAQFYTRFSYCNAYRSRIATHKTFLDLLLREHTRLFIGPLFPWQQSGKCKPIIGMSFKLKLLCSLKKGRKEVLLKESGKPFNTDRSKAIKTSLVETSLSLKFS